MSDLNLDGLTDAQKRLFAVRCARRVQHLMTDPRSIAALDVAERHTRGEATDAGLWAAYSASRAASRAAAWTAAYSASAYSASRAAAWTVTWDAAYAAAAAAVAAVADAELAAQAEILEQIRQEQPR